MPELPDIELYVSRIAERVVGSPLHSISFHNPFVLRTVAVAPTEFLDREVLSVFRIGKRIALEFSDEHFAIVHLMISGRFSWHDPAPPIKRQTGKIQLTAFRFSCGQLTLQESSTRKRASIHLVHGRTGLHEFDRGGMDVFSATSGSFSDRLRKENRTLKRALTDPTKFDGIGNAYSDEILFWAKLSPVRRTQSLSLEEVDRLRVGAQTTLSSWRDRLAIRYPSFPKPSEITAFRPEFAVHGKFGLPCPECGTAVQRIVYAENETNYCAKCQNESRLLADRSLSRLLKDDWPKTLEEMLGERVPTSHPVPHPSADDSGHQ